MGSMFCQLLRVRREIQRIDGTKIPHIQHRNIHRKSFHCLRLSLCLAQRWVYAGRSRPGFRLVWSPYKKSSLELCRPITHFRITKLAAGKKHWCTMVEAGGTETSCGWFSELHIPRRLQLDVGRWITWVWRNQVPDVCYQLEGIERIEVGHHHSIWNCSSRHDGDELEIVCVDTQQADDMHVGFPSRCFWGRFHVSNECFLK